MNTFVLQTIQQNQSYNYYHYYYFMGENFETERAEMTFPR